MFFPGNSGNCSKVDEPFKEWTCWFYDSDARLIFFDRVTTLKAADKLKARHLTPPKTGGVSVTQVWRKKNKQLGESNANIGWAS